ncbi:SRPBCC family protein [Noviherbaspirillum aridicola]|uniref:BON domain-containing protein n=1 Tax=Noviherbaspirillum aridicola TaxID=2849687 RepID=A0ABQ4Q0D3_9BURK|nr:SRPBCC family protein [Noviherbaspirillum aridicola]GIZ50486.1 hypothetical protein NCCP691_05000 [Noviherbaspirillum aridicola]
MYRYSASNPSRMTWLLGGAAAGLLAMYFGDQEHGRRRRKLASDKLRSAAARSGSAIDTASRDLGNRLHGLRAQAQRAMNRSNLMVDDEVLVARVRQRIGRAVSHPRAIDVRAQLGRVTLGGTVPAHEKPHLLAVVNKVLGVSHVEDRLVVHEEGMQVPAPQGGRQRGLARSAWPPGWRAAAVAAGGTLAALGLSSRNPARMLSAVAGMGLVARGLSNASLLQAAGLREGGGVLMHKTIHIDAAPEAVFDLWSKVEDFPRFMSHVREVRNLGNGRSHWKVTGPGGMTLEWDARVTASEPPRLLAWESETGASVRNRGTIRFEPEGGGTRVSVQLSYQPPSGLIGHAVARLLHGDPKRQMDDDLMRMKQFLETGQIPHDASRPGQGASMRTLGAMRPAPDLPRSLPPDPPTADPDALRAGPT